MRSVLKAFNAAALICGVAASCLCPAAASALDAAAEQAGIGSALQAGYSTSFRTKNAAGILALYDEQAEIVTFSAGLIGKAAFETLLGKTLQGWKTAEANVIVEKASFSGEDVARITYLLQVSGSIDGQPKLVVRQDRWYAELRRSGSGWLIRRQGYREDFGVAASPHGGKSGGADASTGHGPGVWH